MREFDLFGRPLPRNLGKPGRNEHVPTPENVSKIRLLVAADWSRAEIAAELGISAPTLRKHYFRELARAKEIALRELRGKIMIALHDQVEKGNVAAMKELGKIVEREMIARLPKRHAKPDPARPEKLGKKERRRIEARKPSGGWADRLPGTDTVQ